MLFFLNYLNLILKSLHFYDINLTNNEFYDYFNVFGGIDLSLIDLPKIPKTL